MASLSSIMNVDDGQDSTSQPQRKTEPPVPNPYQTAGPQAPPSTTNYSSPYRSASTQGHLRSPMPPSLSIYSSEPLPSPTTLVAAQGEPSRRPSTTSTDSMDSPYAPIHGYPYAGSPANPSMSRSMPGSSGTSPPVKLTPITKKPSRALKGVPVHVCELCQPHKTFTRAEHLRRHQLSHTPPELHCAFPGCGKVFHRRDLLERHQQRHEQDNQMSGGGSRGQDPYPLNPIYTMPPPMVPPLHDSPHMGDSMAQRPWPHPQGGSSHGGPSTGPPQINDGSPEYPGGPSDYIHPGFNYSTASVAFPPEALPTDNSRYGLGILGQPTHFVMPNDPSASTPFASAATPASSSSMGNVSSPYSTVSDSSRSHLSTTMSALEWNDQLGTLGPVSRGFTSPMGGEGRSIWNTGYTGSPPPIFPLLDDGVDLLGLTYGDQDISRPRATQALTTRALSPVRATTFPSASVMTGAVPLPFSLRSGCGDRSGRPPSTSELGSGGLFVLDPETVDAIPELLEVYWDRVHPLYPIVHKPTLRLCKDDDAELAAVIQCVMAAVATQLSTSAEDRIRGHQLHAYAWHKSKKFTQGEEWSIPAMQTVLLCEYYSRFRGRSRDAYKASPRFSVLLNKVCLARHRVPKHLGTSDDAASWRTWVTTESLRRLVSAAFLLDVHSKNYLEQSAAFSESLGYHDPQMLPVPLTKGTDELWAAPTLEAWKRLAGRVIASEMVSNVNLAALTSVDIAKAPPFDQVVLLAVHSLLLPQRRQLTKVVLSDSGPPIDLQAHRICRLFPESPCGNTYIALHNTPLRTLLSVCGDSWLLNMKVQNSEFYNEQCKQLEAWRNSGTAAIATIFAARALRSFLGFRSKGDDSSPVVFPWRSSGHQWKDMSDFWAVYVCTLICWVFGTNGQRARQSIKGSIGDEASTALAKQWIADVGTMDLAQVYDMAGTEVAQGLVRLVLPILERDCLGGRNMLYADSVNVLKKLVDGDGWRWA